MQQFLSERQPFGETLVHFIIKKGRLDVLRYLKAQNVDLSGRPDGITEEPANQAACYGQIEVLRF